MSSEFNYDQDLAIDPHKLDEEWLHQASLYMRYSELASQAQLEANKAKENIDVVRAELDAEIRKNPGNHNCPVDKSDNPKPTEAWVSATIIIQPRYQQASEIYGQARLRSDLLQAAVRAFDHRKKALENLVQLWSAGYWATPNDKRIVQGGKRILEQALDRSSDKQREALSASRAQAEPATETAPAPVRRRG